MTIEEKINIIKKTSIFKNLLEDDLRQIAEVARVTYYNSGDLIFEENSNANAFYIIAKGKVEILKKGEQDSQEVLAFKKDGDVFGELSVIDDLPRSASIRAKTDLTLLQLSKNIFIELLKSFSHISLEIARSICSTVRTTNQNYINDLEKRNKQLKSAYKKLKNTQSELIRMEKLSVVGKFASLIIHDIKNPMTNIKAYSELIKINVPDNNKVQKATKVIIEEVDRLSDMASELLDFSRGEMQLDKTPINLSSFISTMIDTVNEDLKKRNITIVFQEKCDSVAMVDISKIKRVFYNLVSNAADALVSGGKITIKTADDGNWLKWTIKDNGIGMEPDVLKQIFEPFYTKNKKRGTGLGMTIVKGIIDNHGGYIKPVSKKDTGTRFDIFLPKA